MHVLRSLDDAIALSAAAEAGKTIAIIGGGFIGLEAAAFLAKRGLAPTVISRDPPLASRFGEVVSHGLVSHHAKNGVRFRSGSIARLRGDPRVEAVELADGDTIAADLVLLATGAAPETQALQGVARREDGGIDVAADLSIAPGVYLAGDIAAVPIDPRGERVRIEHWRVAEQHGMHVARAIMGKSGPFKGAPFFWSNQGDKRLDYAGHASDWQRVVTRGDPDTLDFIAYYIDDGNAVAACAVGQNPALIAFLERLDSGRPLSLDEIVGG